MAYTPYAGTAGGVTYGAGSTAFAGITSWRLNKKVETVQVTNFESTADSNGIVWEEYLAGIGSATCLIEGIFNGDTTNSEEAIPIGTSVTLDLYFRKAATAVGYANVAAFCTAFNPSTDLRDKGKFTAEFVVTGTPPVAA